MPNPFLCQEELKQTRNISNKKFIFLKNMKKLILVILFRGAKKKTKTTRPPRYVETAQERLDYMTWY